MSCGTLNFCGSRTPPSSVLPNLHAIRVSLAKYMANPGLQADLLSTGDEAIVHPDSDFWGTWNGVIQVRGAAEVMCFCQLYLVPWSWDIGAWFRGR